MTGTPSPKKVAGFESPFGLELLATVHWVIKHEQADTVEEVVSRIHAWHERKLQFTRRQIGLAVDVLSQNGWVHLHYKHQTTLPGNLSDIEKNEKKTAAKK